jgi:hypothetical protein
LNRKLTVSEFQALLSDTGNIINDGNNGLDVAVNIGLNFRQVDILALAERILALGDNSSNEVSETVQDDSTDDPIYSPSRTISLSHTVTLASGARVSNLDFGNSFSAQSDFNDDGSSDLLWRNTVTDDIALWLMDGIAAVDGGFIEMKPGPSWQVAAVGNFDTDGHDDLLWFNEISGEIAVWQMDGLAPAGGGVLPITVDPVVWDLKGVGDFDQDGSKDDLLWRNTFSGENRIWYMDGMTPTTSEALLEVPVGGWDIAGVGDFEGTGIQDDIVWRNYSTGENVIWLMNGSTPMLGVPILSIPDVNWHIEGAVDMNRDGASDLLWRNYADGSTVVWYMDSTTPTTNAVIAPAVPDTNWYVTV